MAVEVSLTTLEGAARGDSGSFATIVRAYQGLVYSICWHVLHDDAVAEELAQDVFLHLHRSIREIETPSHLVSWLRRVAMHRAIDQSRRRKLRPRIGLEDAPEPSVQPGVADPLLTERLQKVVASLPERARAIVVLRYQEELEPAEIAESLGIPVGTVKSSLHRSLAWLRGRLERKTGPQKWKGVAL